MSKYSVGVYSTSATDWVPDNSAELCAQVNAKPATPVSVRPDGTATIETYTVRYDWPVRTGIVVGRLDSDNSRFLALVDDENLVELLSHGEPLGARITVLPTEKGNRPVPA